MIYLFTGNTSKRVFENGDFDYDTVMFSTNKPTSSGTDFSEMVLIRGEGVISGLSGSLIGVSLSSVHCFPVLADHLNPRIEME